MKITIAAMALSLIANAVQSPAPLLPAPDRTVSGHQLISTSDPAVRISVPAAARYVGNARWALYDVADCEIHVFVEADTQRRVQRFYWIQFESFLPTVPDRRYDYSANPLNIREQRWGLDVWRRARFGPTSQPPQSGSDLERAMALIASAGYSLPPHMMNVRFVLLLDDPENRGVGRREMLIFYNEDMGPTGLTSMDLIDGDGGPTSRINERWAPIEAALIDRAVGRIAVEPLADR